MSQKELDRYSLLSQVLAKQGTGGSSSLPSYIIPIVNPAALLSPKKFRTSRNICVRVHGIEKKSRIKKASPSALNVAEINGEELSMATQQKMCLRILEQLRDTTYKGDGTAENGINRTIEIVKLAAWNPSMGMPTDRQLGLLFDAWIEQQPDAYDDDEKYTSDGITLDLEKIKANIEDFMKDATGTAMDRSIPQIGLPKLSSCLAPVHQMAKGMLSNCGERQWNQLSSSSVENFDQKVQGSMDRQKIVNCIKIDLGYDVKESHTEEIQKKVGWLKEWIMDKNTTEEEVKGLLKFITGTSSLAAGVELEIVIKEEGSNDPTPRSHTCFNRMELSPKPCGISTINDRTREGFFNILRREAREQKTDMTEV